MRASAKRILQTVGFGSVLFAALRSGARLRSGRPASRGEASFEDRGCDDDLPWVGSVYTAERGELAGIVQQLLATLSVAVAYIGTFVVATAALPGDAIPDEVALAAPLVAFGMASALTGLYANSVAHSHVIQGIEAHMSRRFRDSAGNAIARGESVGGFSYGGGGTRNLHFTVINMLTYGGAFVVLALFTVY